MRKKLVVIFVGLLLIVLAACTPQAGGLPGTGGETPPAETPAGTPAITPETTPQAALNALAWLPEQLGVPAEQLQIVNVEKVDWTDSCLGLGGPAESCLQAITPGWRITFAAAGQEYEVRTDETGSTVRMVTTPSEAPGAADPLAGTQWRLESFGPTGSETPVVSGSTVTLDFGTDGQAGGSGGCNTYGASYEVQSGELSFREVVSTEMACLEEGLMDQEQRFFQALGSTGTFELAGDRLTVQYDDGQGVLNFVKAESGTPSETPGASDPLSGTQWNLESYGPVGSETPVVEGSTVTLEFGAGGQAGGSGGCNSYGAEYQVDGGKLSFGQITSTLMACADEGVMDQEQRYFQALQNAGEFTLDSDRLTILYDDGQGALNFVK